MAWHSDTFARSGTVDTGDAQKIDQAADRHRAAMTKVVNGDEARRAERRPISPGSGAVGADPAKLAARPPDRAEGIFVAAMFARAHQRNVRSPRLGLPSSSCALDCTPGCRR
jgi:hypothetical protein